MYVSVVIISNDSLLCLVPLTMCSVCYVQPLIVQYMTKIRNIMSQQKVSTRIKFMLQDVVELRDVRTVYTVVTLMIDS